MWVQHAGYSMDDDDAGANGRFGTVVKHSEDRRAQWDRLPHGEPPLFASLESKPHRVGRPLIESHSTELG